MTCCKSSPTVFESSPYCKVCVSVSVFVSGVLQTPVPERALQQRADSDVHVVGEHNVPTTVSTAAAAGCPDAKIAAAVLAWQVLKLENDRVRMWDFRSSLEMDRNAFHQHVLDNAWVVIGDGSSLNVYVPGTGSAPAVEKVKTVAFSDGFVSWTAVDKGGFDTDGKTRLTPSLLHSVDNTSEAEFWEYLIELK